MTLVLWLTDKLPYVTHLSQCDYRVRFYTQEIVLFREDMQYRMRRSCICTPSEEETNDPFEHVRSPPTPFVNLGPQHLYSKISSKVVPTLTIQGGLTVTSYVQHALRIEELQ